MFEICTFEFGTKKTEVCSEVCFVVNGLILILYSWGRHLDHQTQHCTRHKCRELRGFLSCLCKQILCAQVPKAVTHWQSVARFPEFSASKTSLVMLTLLFRMAFELCHHGRGGADKREIFCWPVFFQTRLLHFARCTLNTGTGGLASIDVGSAAFHLHSMMHSCTVQLHIAHLLTGWGLGSIWSITVLVLLAGRCSHLSDQQILGARRTREASTYSLQALLNRKLLAHPGKICMPAILFDLYSLQNWETYLYNRVWQCMFAEWHLHVEWACKQVPSPGTGRPGLNGTSHNPKVTYEQTFSATVFPWKPMPFLRKYSLENEAPRGQTDTQHPDTPRGPSETPQQTLIQIHSKLLSHQTYFLNWNLKQNHHIKFCLFVWPMPPSGSSTHQYFKSQSAFLLRARSDEWRVIGTFHKP